MLKMFLPNPMGTYLSSIHWHLSTASSATLLSFLWPWDTISEHAGQTGGIRELSPWEQLQSVINRDFFTPLVGQLSVPLSGGSSPSYPTLSFFHFLPPPLS